MTITEKMAEFIVKYSEFACLCCNGRKRCKELGKSTGDCIAGIVDFFEHSTQNRTTEKSSICKSGKCRERDIKGADMVQQACDFAIKGKIIYPCSPLTIKQLKSLKKGDWVWVQESGSEGCGVLPGYYQIELFAVTHIHFKQGCGTSVIPNALYEKDWLAFKTKEQAEMWFKKTQEEK